MIKYANSDINDGVNSVKIGLGNIIASLIKKEIAEYTLPFKINYLIASGALKEMFKNANFLYSDKFININIENQSINIYFNDDNIKFIKT